MTLEDEKAARVARLVENAKYQAEGFTWGVQWAGGVFTGDPFEFANLWAEHVRRHEVGDSSHRKSIQGAFDLWRDGKPLDGSSAA